MRQIQNNIYTCISANQTTTGIIIMDWNNEIDLE